MLVCLGHTAAPVTLARCGGLPVPLPGTASARPYRSVALRVGGQNLEFRGGVEYRLLSKNRKIDSKSFEHTH